MSQERAIITPEQGKVSEVGKLLLALADSHTDIGTTTDGPLGFAYTAPVDVYEKFLTAAGLVEESSQDEGDPDELEPAPRKRGRPRKTAPTLEQES